MAVRWWHCGCAPIQLAQCRFPGLIISNAIANILIYFSNKIYESNFIKQHSESIVVLNYQTAFCILSKEIYCVICFIFRHTFVHSSFSKISMVWSSMACCTRIHITFIYLLWADVSCGRDAAQRLSRRTAIAASRLSYIKKNTSTQLTTILVV